MNATPLESNQSNQRQCHLSELFEDANQVLQLVEQVRENRPACSRIFV